MDTPAARLDALALRLAPHVTQAAVSFGLVAAELDAARVLPVAQWLRADGFDMLLDITAIDWPQRTPRFDVVWHFYSTRSFLRVRLKCGVALDACEVDSLTGLYRAAHVAERECHEMYGVRFRGNADLRPLLLYEGFVGHPLRKDYPIDREQPLVPSRLP